MIQKLKDLEVYVRTLDLAMQVFELTWSFPEEKFYSLENIEK